MKTILRQTIGLTAALALLAGPALAQQTNWQNQNHGTPPQHEQPMAPQHAMAPPQHQAYAPQHENHAPQHNWHQGDHYSGSRVVVRDWGDHHLRQPPAGYEWVQDGDQYVLIAITSGVIASIIANAISQ